MANATPKLLEKIVKRMHSRNELKGAPKIEVAGAERPPERTVGSGLLKLSNKKRRPEFRLQISRPEPIPEGSLWNMHAKSSSDDTTTITQPAHLRSTKGSKLKHRLAKARLSPMEYARIYLIENALSERENRHCELPRPEKKWFWTPGWEKFLIIPKIPASIRRDLGSPAVTGDGCSTKLVQRKKGDSTDSVSMLKPPPKDDWKRLSLHLGDSPILLPDFLRVSSFGLVDQTPESDTETLKPDAKEAKSCDEDELARGMISSQRVPQSPESPTQHDIRQVGRFVAGPEFLQHIQETIKNTSYHGSSLMDEAASKYGIKAMTREDGRSASPQLPEGTTLVVTKKKMNEQPFTTPKALRPRGIVGKRPHPALSEFSPSVRPSPMTSRRVVTHSPESCTPLARFPISARQSARLTPSTLIKHIVGGAGGQLHPNDSHRAQIVHSHSAEFPAASSADLWGSLSGDPRTESLRPEPLRIGGRNCQNNEERRGQWPKILGDLSPLGQEDQNESGPDNAHQMAETSLEEDQHQISPTGGHETLTISKRRDRQVQDVPAVPGTVRRFSSTNMTPTSSTKCLQFESPVRKTQTSPSGFTPRHVKDEAESLTTRYLMRSDENKGEPPEANGYSKTVRGAQDMQRHENAMFEDDPSTRGRQFDASLDQSIPPTPPQLYRSRALARRVARRYDRDDATRYDRSGRNFVSKYSDGRPQMGNLSTHVQPQGRPSAYLRQHSDSFGSPKGTSGVQGLSDVSHTSSRGHDTDEEAVSPKPGSSDLSRTEMMQTPSLESTELSVPHTPSSTIGGLFRKRNRSQNRGSTPRTPRTPRTPSTPSTVWRPFDGPDVEQTRASSWLARADEKLPPKSERTLHWKEKAGQLESQSPDSLRGSSIRKPSSLSQMRSRESIRSSLRFSRRQSMENLVEWPRFIADTSGAFPSSPAPPVPPLPTPSRLESLCSVAELEAEGEDTADYKAKKLYGSQREPRKLRKINKEVSWGRTPKTTQSTSGLRSVFMKDAMRVGSGRRAVDDRVDEVVRRHM